ncbi:glycosyl transferase family 1 [Nonlabens tegetincola]|uniref:glycosyltransferase n=1 Tax=Nonlabens tegetincola TaxID=323273 RepID=UPI000A204ABF|nr:glycosyltransferase [Nonlabens tegetincola]ARN71577.1 glycosyl transferase family 1 [Nonlabens tegetincola]
MKILLVSMNSLHFTRWTNQLRDSGHEVHWFNIRSGAIDPQLDFVTQNTNWRYRIKRGRGWIKKVPVLHQLNERHVEPTFRKALQQIQPDIVHSFALYVAAAPILSVMLQNDIPWLLSTWGSDLFYFQNDAAYLKDIKAVLPRVNYLFTDCNRDHALARKYGFYGKHLGTFPGGGGFPVKKLQRNRQENKDRNIILVKGNHNRSGRSKQVLQALEQINDQLSAWKVIVFNAINREIKAFEDSIIPNIEIHSAIPHEELLKLMQKTAIYIGNSNSDGIPNTMLEAIICGAFPIQSNPGGATAEWIENEKNGLLIHYCENVEHIKGIIIKALKNPRLRQQAISYNNTYVVPNLEREMIKEQVQSAYSAILP